MPGSSRPEPATSPRPEPSPAPLSPPEEREVLASFKELTERVLPALAREQRWPVRHDHCFKRICLDHAFGDVWYRHLARPAERHLSGQPLRDALACAELIHQEGLPTLMLRNRASLRWRGKLPGESAP